uniref:Transcriptional regulator n=1 Tax=Macrostomum lignano TaxID=282301 RepID=A0A1I8I5F3_9PLAT
MVETKLRATKSVTSITLKHAERLSEN